MQINSVLIFKLYYLSGELPRPIAAPILAPIMIPSGPKNAPKTPPIIAPTAVFSFLMLSVLLLGYGALVLPCCDLAVIVCFVPFYKTITSPLF